MNIIETNLEFNSNKTKMGVIEGIGLHHTGEKTLQSIETIHSYHKNTKKWAGIGYHYYVRKDGTTYKGRDLAYAGAHCPGINSISIGICAEGNFNEEIMSDVQKNAIIELIAYLKTKYNIKWIKGHREVINTSCPGTNFPLEEIKSGQTVVENATVGKNQTVQTYTYKDFVRDVQKATGAKVDGVAGKETLSKTVTVSKRKNNKHAVVRPIQTYLNALGFNCGAVDGIAGKLFDNAVKNYQKANSCVCDGEITARNKTWKKLLKLA